MTVIKVAAGIEKHFFMASNDFARDASIPARAAKVYIYLVSHQEGWRVSVRSVAKATGMGKNTVASALRDLEEAGFIDRQQVKDESGQFAGTEYLIHRERQPRTQNGDTVEDGRDPETGTRNDQQERDIDAGQSRNPKNGTPENGQPFFGSHKKTNSLEKTSREEDQEEEPPVVPQGGPAPKPKKGHRLPEGWMPDPDVIDAMRQENPGVDLQREHAKFSDHWAAASGANASKRDWNAAWRNWIRRAADSYPARSQARPLSREEKLRAWGAPSQVHVPQDSPRELTW